MKFNLSQKTYIFIIISLLVLLFISLDYKSDNWQSTFWTMFAALAQGIAALATFLMLKETKEQAKLTNEQFIYLNRVSCKFFKSLIEIVEYSNGEIIEYQKITFTNTGAKTFTVIDLHFKIVNEGYLNDFQFVDNYNDIKNANITLNPGESMQLFINITNLKIESNFKPAQLQISTNFGPSAVIIDYYCI